MKVSLTSQYSKIECEISESEHDIKSLTIIGDEVTERVSFFNNNGDRVLVVTRGEEYPEWAEPYLEEAHACFLR